MLSHEKKTFSVGRIRSYAVPRKENIFGREDSVICCPTKRKHLGRDGFGHMLSHEKKTFSVGRIRSYAVPRKENIFGREDSVICCHTKRIFLG